MSQDLVFLDQYVLQKDMRIRLPKSVLANLGATKGETMFAIYFDKNNGTIILKKAVTATECTQSEE